MANDLVASLVLRLDDQLAGPLHRLQDQLDQLRGVAEKVQLSGLQKSEQIVDVLREKIGQTQSILSRVGVVAREVGDTFRVMGRMAVTGFNEAGHAAAQLHGKMKEFGEAGSNLINKGFGAAAEGFAVYEPIKKFADQENIVRHIGITEGLSGPALDERIKYLITFFRHDALKTGQSSESIAQAYQDLTQMGIHENLEKIIQAHSQAATAYNTTAEALGPAVGALIQTMKVPAAELSNSLAAMAQASKEGRFKIEDFSRELPGVAAQMALLGMTGRKGADITFAALETVMRGSSQPGQAATNLTDLMTYIRGPFGQRTFAKHGINLDAILQAGLAKSRAGTGSVLDELLKRMAALTKGMNQVTMAETIGKLFHNQQAGSALVTLLQQRAEYEKIKAQLDKVDRGIVDRDTISAINAPLVQLRMMGETVEQISEQLGQGFLPVLKAVNIGLLWINSSLEWANKNYPTATAWVLWSVAALLALGAAITLIGAIVPVFTTGWALIAGTFGAGAKAVRGVVNAVQYLLFVIEYFTGASALMVGAVVAIAAVFAAAAYDIYAHWSRFAGFFEQMWAGVRQVFHGFIDFIAGIFTGDLHRAFGGLETIGHGVVTIFSGMWGTVKQLFIDFGAWVEGWAPGLGARIGHAIVDPLREQFDEIANLPHALENGWIGRHLGLADTVAAKAGTPPANDNTGARAVAATKTSSHHVTVRVQAEPGTRITAANSDSPATTVHAPVQAPNRGATLSRP